MRLTPAHQMFIQAVYCFSSFIKPNFRHNNISKTLYPTSKKFILYLKIHTWSLTSVQIGERWFSYRDKKYFYKVLRYELLKNK